MPSNRCRHYYLETELILVPGVAGVLRIPTRRCKLAERMIVRIAETPAGQEVARKLTFISPMSPPAPNTDFTTSLPDATLLRAIFGPDLEPIHPMDCVVQRCLESCTPGYNSLLAQYGQSAEAEPETGQDCLADIEYAIEHNEDSEYNEDSLDPHS